MNIQSTKASLEYLFKAQLTAFLWGRAGIGKTSIVKQYAGDKGWKFFALYLGTQSDIGDVLGLAEFVDNGDGSKSTDFATPKWLNDIIEYCTANPKSGAIIFLDEFNRARRDIISGMFSLALDKTFHKIKLPKNCHVIAAGNPPTDEYYVTDVNDTALMSRFVHVKLEPTFEEFLSYAQTIEMNSTLTGFLKNQPELLEDKHTDFELPVKVDRRSFERLDKLFKLNTPKELIEQLMPGIIGLERTVAYMNYLKSSETPLTGEEVINKSKFELVMKWSNPENIMASLLNLTCENLEKHLQELHDKKAMLDAHSKANLMEFLHTAPKDISYPMMERLTNASNEVFKDFTVDALYEDQLVSLIKSAKGTKKTEETEEK